MFDERLATNLAGPMVKIFDWKLHILGSPPGSEQRQALLMIPNTDETGVQWCHCFVVVSPEYNLNDKSFRSHSMSYTGAKFNSVFGYASRFLGS